MTRLTTAPGLFTLALFAAGCASDPNKNVDDARDAQLRAATAQSEGRAEDKSNNKVAEATREKNATQTHAEQSNAHDANKDVAVADAKMKLARDEYRAKATERLEKLDAKRSELAVRLDRAGPKASTKSRDALQLTGTQRATVAQGLLALPQVPRENWSGATSKLDTDLDQLETLITAAAKEVDKAPK